MRLAALDGLRGVAAVAVVIGHARLILLDHPVLALPGVGAVASEFGVLAGRAVWLFFVLSGVVLCRLATRAPRFDYGPYLLSRVARLYIPVTAAVLFALGTIIVVPRGPGGLGTWIDSHPHEITPAAVLADLTLVAGTSGSLSPLWSLQWEVLFSLLLALYVSSLRRLRPVVGIVVCVVLSAAGAALESGALFYLPMFGIGVSLWFAWGAIAQRLTHPLHASGRARSLLAAIVLALVLVLAAGLASSTVYLAQSGWNPALLRAADAAGSLTGVVLVIVVVGFDRTARSVLSSRVFRWLGVISFSLYLVHEPILIGATRLGGRSAVIVIVAVVLSFVFAALFSRIVERPAHRLSQRLRSSGV
ncbi:acyltransferase [Herbiconiux sp. CPCC 203407]|uniref:Acyltransferase n=1 Tax=Herbiconiux oxytropis TaxID=2970915 RepID=A0AA41XEX2_9MICO|nr:acyltransferase [Herbiconiux oxytropis]MCS5720724.1 acyltransferase [Herbiconiux oxytropis]MCS5724949.1 acyltransferase [Herbiconiux oxytropis]